MHDPAEAFDATIVQLDGAHAVAVALIVAGRHLQPALTFRFRERLTIVDPAHGLGV
jgi:hypothetical protein